MAWRSTRTRLKFDFHTVHDVYISNNRSRLRPASAWTLQRWTMLATLDEMPATCRRRSFHKR